MRLLIAAAVALLTAAPASAAQLDGCAGFKWQINREQTAFASQNLPTINASAQIPGVMEAVVVKLAKQSELTFDVPPSHKPQHTPAYAGSFPMMFTQVAGPYNITVSGDAWIDVVQNGKLLRQTGYTGSKTCPDVRKSVQFELDMGPSTIMITDAATETLKLEVLPPPPK